MESYGFGFTEQDDDLDIILDTFINMSKDSTSLCTRTKCNGGKYKKRKPWISLAIINSIKTRDFLYCKTLMMNLRKNIITTEMN